MKTVLIKNKQYTPVSERILYLKNEIQDYSIETDYTYFPERKMWVVKARLTIKPTQEGNTFTGLAQEIESDDWKQVNFTSALENAETSAVGRACAMAGIGIIDSIASVDEINKANYWKQKKEKETTKAKIQGIMDELPPEPKITDGGYKINKKQAEEIFDNPPF